MWEHFRQMHFWYVLSAETKQQEPNKISNEPSCWKFCPNKIQHQLPHMHSTMAIMFFIIKTCYWAGFSIINDFLDISDPTMMPPHIVAASRIGSPSSLDASPSSWTGQPLAPKQLLVACHDILMFILYVKNAEKRYRHAPTRTHTHTHTPTRQSESTKTC